MKSLDPSVNHVLEQLRVLDPERALRLEAAIAENRADARDAEFALVDLADGAQRMVLDLLQSKSPREHVDDAIAQNVIPVRPTVARREVALRYLARATDHEAFASSGREPEAFLFQHLLELAAGQTAQPDVEAVHMEGLRILRQAMKLARAEEIPDI